MEKYIEAITAAINKTPDIIKAASQSWLGIASLIVLVLGIVTLFLFWGAPGRPRLIAFVLMIGGLLSLLAFVYVPPCKDVPEISHTEPRPSEWMPTDYNLARFPPLEISVASNERIVDALVEEDVTRHGGNGPITLSPSEISADRRTARGTCAAQSGLANTNTSGWCHIRATVDVITQAKKSCPAT